MPVAMNSSRLLAKSKLIDAGNSSLLIMIYSSAQDVFNKVRDVVYANGEIAYETLFAL